MTGDAMRAVGYVRISKADRNKTEDEQRLSIRAQRRAITQACKAKGWELLDVYEDFARSGTDDEREDFKRVQHVIDAKEADVVVVTRLDRLSRKAWRLLWLIEEQGWNIFAIEQNFDTREPEGWLAAAIHALMADYERRLIAKRTRQALAQNKREGKHNGRKSLIPAEVEAQIVAMSREQGMSATAIARVLETNNTPRPAKGKWHHSHITAVLRREDVRRNAERQAS